MMTMTMMMMMTRMTKTETETATGLAVVAVVGFQGQRLSLSTRTPGTLKALFFRHPLPQVRSLWHMVGVNHGYLYVDARPHVDAPRPSLAADDPHPPPGQHLRPRAHCPWPIEPIAHTSFK